MRDVNEEALKLLNSIAMASALFHLGVDYLTFVKN